MVKPSDGPRTLAHVAGGRAPTVGSASTRPLSLSRLGAVGVLVAGVVLLLAFGLPNRTDDEAAQRIDLEERVRDVAGKTDSYRAPRRKERQVLAEGLVLALGRNWDQARQRLDQEDYNLRRRVDAGTGRPFLEIHESGDTSRGWASLFVDLSTPTRVAIQIPHPRSDVRTELLGVQLFRRRPGSVLLVAGAHRNAGRGDAADVAHRTDSIFHEFAEVLSRNDFSAIQLHGFHDDSLRGVDVVVSTGAAPINTPSQRIAEQLRSEGLRVCTAWDTRCRALEGKTNVQGQAIAARRGTFLHIELSRNVRDSDKLRDTVIAVLVRAMRSEPSSAR